MASNKEINENYVKSEERRTQAEAQLAQIQPMLHATRDLLTVREERKLPKLLGHFPFNRQNAVLQWRTALREYEAAAPAAPAAAAAAAAAAGDPPGATPARAAGARAVESAPIFFDKGIAC